METGNRAYRKESMGKIDKEPIRIDLDQFKLHIKVSDKIELSLHFDSPSRRFYLSVMAFVVHEMQKLGRITSIPLEEHYELLALLNETVGASAGSSKKKKLIPRIYRKWKSALPDIENAPLFKIVGRNKYYENGGLILDWSNIFENISVWYNLFIEWYLEQPIYGQVLVIIGIITVMALIITLLYSSSRELRI